MDTLKPSGRAWCTVPGGQDDKSPVTRICRGPDYAELTPHGMRRAWLGR